MKRFLKCLGGGSSSKVVQDPSEPPQPPQLPQPPQPPEPSEPSDPSEPTDSSETVDDNDVGFRENFRWREILDGTENFRITRFLGRGDLGEVYRCDLPSINQVGAAKIHDHDNQPGNAEFVAEITALHESGHQNVIKLLGKSFSRDNSAIVYEFLPNGSLDHHLFANSMPGPGLRQKTRRLDWDTRMRIAVGVAEALVYVHDRLKEIHRDVKVSNILLDEDFEPKLSDFGLAIKIVKNADGTERQVKINMAKGSRGYMAPEAEDFGLFSTKSDVYSYGVFLFELCTGRKAYDLARPAATRKITDWLMPVWSREENFCLVADVALGKKFSVEGLNRLFFTARMCIDAQATSRPDMGFVETMVRQSAAYPVPECPPVKRRFSI